MSSATANEEKVAEWEGTPWYEPLHRLLIQLDWLDHDFTIIRIWDRFGAMEMEYVFPEGTHKFVIDMARDLVLAAQTKCHFATEDAKWAELEKTVAEAHPDEEE